MPDSEAHYKKVSLIPAILRSDNDFLVCGESIVALVVVKTTSVFRRDVSFPNDEISLLWKNSSFICKCISSFAKTSICMGTARPFNLI